VGQSILVDGFLRHEKNEGLDSKRCIDSKFEVSGRELGCNLAKWDVSETDCLCCSS
jgi:hypothetical protein